MRKLLVSVLALCLLLSLAACGQGGGEPGPDGKPPAVQTDDPEKMGLADLAGSWEMVSGEIEGFTFSVEEGGMVAYLDITEDGIATYREIQTYEPVEIHDNMAVEMQDNALYDGCPNSAWCAQLITDDTDVEYYVTLFDRDTLRLMQYSYFEGEEYPVVFLATFRRMASEAEIADSLSQLREQLQDGDYVCGVAYLGICDGAYADAIRGQLRGTGYIEAYPFLPECQWVDWFGYELYCVVPRDPNASVAVNVWDPFSGEDGEVLYRSESGDPIIIQCNGDEGYNPNTHVTIVDSDGSSVDFFPMLDSGALDVPDRNDPWMYDFTLEGAVKNEMPDAEDIVGDWATYEVIDGNGDSRVCGLSLYGDGTGEYWYGEPYSDIIERFSGTWEISSGVLTLELFLVGGVAYDEGVEPYDYWAQFDVSVWPDGSMTLLHTGGLPLLYGMNSQPVDFVRAMG